jgi:hypothetical protein
MSKLASTQSFSELHSTVLSYGMDHKRLGEILARAQECIAGPEANRPTE